ALRRLRDRRALDAGGVPPRPRPPPPGRGPREPARCGPRRLDELQRRHQRGAVLCDGARARRPLARAVSEVRGVRGRAPARPRARAHRALVRSVRAPRPRRAERAQAGAPPASGRGRLGKESVAPKRQYGPKRGSAPCCREAMHGLDLIGTLTVALAAALAFGFVARRVGLSPIVGYLVAGIAIGPFTPGPVAHAGIAEELAEIGVVLLMFGVGLSFHVHELAKVARVAVPGALAQIAAA